jgi:dTDP-4-amino-4,6-dideoxygalactose transaminase
LGYPTCQAIFENRLKNIKKMMQLQQDNGKRIIDALKENKSFEICQLTEDLNYFMIPVLVKQPSHFIDYARNNGIELGQHFAQSQRIIPFYDYLKGSCMNYEYIVGKIVTIPTHYDYPSTKITRIVNIIKAYNNE